MSLFAVIRTRGAAWRPQRPLEEQAEWPAHAAFMSALHAERFVLLGGPLAGTADTLLIVRAGDRAEIEARLAGDPWATHDLLRVAQVLPWNLRLGSLG